MLYLQHEHGEYIYKQIILFVDPAEKTVDWWTDAF